MIWSDVLSWESAESSIVRDLGWKFWIKRLNPDLIDSVLMILEVEDGVARPGLLLITLEDALDEDDEKGDDAIWTGDVRILVDTDWLRIGVCNFKDLLTDKIVSSKSSSEWSTT